MACQVSSKFFRLGEAYGEQVAITLADLLKVFLHLVQVRPASDSGQMPQKHEDQRPSPEFRKPNRGPVRTDKLAIGNNIASFQQPCSSPCVGRRSRDPAAQLLDHGIKNPHFLPVRFILFDESLVKFCHLVFIVVSLTGETDMQSYVKVAIVHRSLELKGQRAAGE